MLGDQDRLSTIYVNIPQKDKENLMDVHFCHMGCSLK